MRSASVFYLCGRFYNKLRFFDLKLLYPYRTGQRGDNLALTKMERIEIVGLNRERKKLIEYLQRCGVIDISDSREGVLKSRETEQSISQFESYMASASAAIDILSVYGAREGGMFYKRHVLPEREYAITDGEIRSVMGKINDILRIKKTIEKNKEDSAAAAVAKNALSPYMKLDVPMQTKKTKSTLIRLGTLEGEWSAERIWQQLHDAGLEDAYVEILSSTRELTAVWILYPQEEHKRFEEVFTKINLSSPPVKLSHLTPAEKAKRLDDKIASLEAENAGLEKKLAEYVGARDEIELFYDRITVRRDKYRALSNIGVSDKAFFVTGYIPKHAGDALEKSLNKYFTVAVGRYEPEPDEDVPSAFANNGFVSPVEGITSDYSMPSAHDIDPNPIMAGFYYFFFGMMFSDAGYGLIMMIVCGLLGFGNFLEKSKRRMYKMFFFCGVSTTFWGLMYGSFFGDMIATVSKTFGSGRLSLSPILLDPVQKPLNLLIMSVAFGMIHILTALVIKFYMTWREGKRLDAVFDTGFWIALLLGVCVFAAGMGLGIAIVQTIGIVMMIGGAAGLVLTQGRAKKNPIAKLFGGILSLYDITSYVGDALSYSRLMALGLATGVIATVINVLGSLGGKSVIGFISFVLISAFGHALNFAINMLGAYVHTNRLQYVEFYQKFYEGGGRKYKPFGFDTKYYEFK